MRKGFTLIEMVIVMIVISLLGSGVMIVGTRQTQKAKETKAITDLFAIRAAIVALYADTGRFPKGCPALTTSNPDSSLNGTQVGLRGKIYPYVNPHASECEWTDLDVSRWNGPYLEHTSLNDSWQRPYIFDPDYCFCKPDCTFPDSPYGDGKEIDQCDQSEQVVLECIKMCEGPPNYCGYSPPVVKSGGRDRIVYSCDDLIISMQLGKDPGT